MEIDKDLVSYLENSKFSSGKKTRFSNAEKKLLYKDEYLVSLVRGKRIIHFGCIDHVDIIDEKIRQNRWLHKILIENTKICYGIDIDREGIDFVSKKGIEGIYYCNIESDELPADIRNTEWDYLLLGEVLEHVNNPVHFLEEINTKFKGLAKQVIITVPNAFRFENWLYALLEKEYINTDHRYWFTPFTLSKVCTMASLKIEQLELCCSRNPASRYFFMRYFLKRRAMLRDTCLIICDINN
jgi:hypothetical protein